MHFELLSSCFFFCYCCFYISYFSLLHSGYKAHSGSLLLLQVCGGYVCVCVHTPYYNYTDYIMSMRQCAFSEFKHV